MKSYINLQPKSIFKDQQLNSQRRLQVLQIADKIFESPQPDAQSHNSNVDYGFQNKSKLQVDNSDILNLIQHRFKTQTSLKSLETKSVQVAAKLNDDKRTTEYKYSINDSLSESSDIRTLLQIKWNIDSPRFLAAALNCGIERWELKRKTLQQVEKENPDKDQAHVSAIYNLHLRQLRAFLNQVINERNRIIQEPPKQVRSLSNS